MRDLHPQLGGQLSATAWQRARQTAFRRATASRLFPRPGSDADPALQILALHELRRDVARAEASDGRTDPSAAGNALSTTLCQAASARNFFYGYPDLTLYQPIPVAGPSATRRELSALVAELRQRGDPRGIVLRGTRGSGKTVALWKVWHDCFFHRAEEKSPLLDGYLPYWLPSERIADGWKPQEIIPLLIGLEAGLWRPDGTPTVGAGRLIENHFLRHCPPLLILCDLNHVASSVRQKLAQSLCAFQQTRGHQHRCVVADEPQQDEAWPNGYFHSYELTEPDETAAVEYVDNYQQFERAVYEDVNQPPPERDTASEKTLLGRLVKLRNGRILTSLGVPTLMHGVTRLAHISCPTVAGPSPARGIAARQSTRRQTARPRTTRTAHSTAWWTRIRNDLLLLYHLVEGQYDAEQRRRDTTNVDGTLGGPNSHTDFVVYRSSQPSAPAPQSVPPTLASLWTEFQKDATCEYALYCYQQKLLRDWPEELPHPYIEPHFSRRKTRPEDRSQRQATVGGEPESEKGTPFLTEEESDGITDVDQKHWGDKELLRLFRYARQEQRQHGSSRDGMGWRLCVAEDANSGKTVGTRRWKYFFADDAPTAGRARLFHGQTVLAHRWTKWPCGPARNETKTALADDLAAAIQQACPELFPIGSGACNHSGDAAQVVQYALEAGRVVLILDALDQEQNSRTGELIEALRYDARLAACPAIVTGRSFAFNQPEGIRLFCPLEEPRYHWTFVTLLGFDDNQKARFLRDSLPDEFRDGDRFIEVFSPSGYRDMSPLLAVPGLLTMVRDLIRAEVAAARRGGQAFREVAGIRTRCDLHWRYYQEQILGRDLLKLPSTPDRSSYEPLWELMLSVTAFRMVLARLDDYTVPADKLTEIKDDVERYCRAHPVTIGMDDLDRRKFWKDRWNELRAFTTLSDHAIFEPHQHSATLCWRHKSWMEFFCGLFLAKYANPQCLLADPQWLSADVQYSSADPPRLPRRLPLQRIRIQPETAQSEPGFLGVDWAEHQRETNAVERDENVLRDVLHQIGNDPSWSWAWRCAMDVPQITWKSPQLELSVLAHSLAALFSPYSRGQRPTELMYRVWVLFRTNEQTKGHGVQVMVAYQEQFLGLLHCDAALPEGIPNSGRSIAQVAAELIPESRVKELLMSGVLTPERWKEIAPPLAWGWFDATHWNAQFDDWEKSGWGEGTADNVYSPLAQRAFVRCPPVASAEQKTASFRQGTAVEVPVREWKSEWPRHLVRVPSFWMQATVVTVEQYGGLFNPGLYRRHQELFAQAAPAPDFPVIDVTWWDAFCFALWLGAELPTESQWEFACRAGHDGGRDLFGIPWKDPATGELRYDSLSSREANFAGDPFGGAPKGKNRQTAVPVRDRQFCPNAWGLWQMHGNVWEWTRNNYETYRERIERLLRGLHKPFPEDEDLADDELLRVLGTLSEADWQEAEKELCEGEAGAMRVLRGGSWINLANLCRCAYRRRWPPGLRDDINGFRVVVCGGG